MDGILLVDKPSEWTSMDVCAHLRGVLHERHIGHTGTLDPNATGLLVVLTGKGTKAAKYLENDRKEYIARLRLFAFNSFKTFKLIKAGNFNVLNRAVCLA